MADPTKTTQIDPMAVLSRLSERQREVFTGACDQCGTRLTPFLAGGERGIMIYPTTCNACLEAEQEAKRELRCEAAWRAWVTRYNLPMLLLDRAGHALDVLHPRARRVLNLSRDERRNAPCGLWLTGATGTGKTTQLMAIAECAWRGRWADNHNPWIVYLTLSDVLRRHDVEGMSGVLSSAEVLIIDEIVPRAVFDSLGDWFSGWLNERYTARHATFFASNYTPDEIAAEAGNQAGRRALLEARDVDRIYSMIGGPGGILTFTEDYRQGELMELASFWDEEDDQ